MQSVVLFTSLHGTRLSLCKVRRCLRLRYSSGFAGTDAMRSFRRPLEVRFLAPPRASCRELLYYRTSVEKAGHAGGGRDVATAHGENWPIESDDLRKVLEARSGRSLFLSA